MTGTLRKLAIAAALALASVAPSAQAAPKKAKVQQGYTAAAQQVLARARAATGGSGWSLLRGWHETGHQGGQIYERWFDTLRYGMRIETRGPEGVSVRGFNGQGAWKIAPSGVSTPVDDPAAAAEIRTEAFLGASGYLYIGRFDAHGEIVSPRQPAGRSFDVVNVQPWSGAARQLWFDRKTHLLGRVVDRSGSQVLTTELSDYRRIGPVRVPFHAVTRGADSAVIEDRQADSIVFTPPDRALFSLPRTDGR